MPDKQHEFDAAMERLAEEARRGVAITHPLSAEQEEAIRIAVKQQMQENQPKIEQSRDVDRDQGQDIEM